MRALVVGGGIGGLAVALFLRRTGWEVEVLESSAEGEPAEGAFLNVATNGLHVLAELGLRDRLMLEGHRCPRMVMWSGLGKRLGEVPNGPAGDPTRGSTVVRRAWLHQVLRDAAAEASVAVVLDARVARLEESEESEDQVTVVTADGRRFTGDLAIGADGVGSVVRRFVDPAAPAPRYTGLVGLGGFATGTGLPPTPETQHFVFGRRSFFGYLVREDGTVFWFANLTHREVDRNALRAVLSTTWLQRLRVLHADDVAPVPAILAAADSTVGAYPIYDLPAVQRWRRGRTVCLGDAVHAVDPSAGQGASLALEDAQLLAQCVRDLTPVGSALEAYQRLRQPRAEAVVAYARTIGRRKTVTTNRLAMAVRDWMLPVFLRRAASDTTQNWLYDYRVDWSARVRPGADIDDLTGAVSSL